MPCEKVRYGSKQFAEMDIVRIQSKSQRSKVPQRAYFCHECHSWHLTSQLSEIQMEDKQRIQFLLKENEMLKDKNKQLENQNIQLKEENQKLKKETMIYKNMIL